MAKELANDFTQGEISRHLCRFALPFLLSNFLQACYGAVDSIVVGHTVGAAGTSAVGIGSQLMVVITAACTGLCMGGTITLAQHKGRGDRQGQIDTIGTFFSSVFIEAVVLSVLGIVFAPGIVRFLNAPEASYEQAVSYLRICCGGIVFIFGYNSICAMFRGLGNSRSPLYFVLVAAICNVGLDLLLVVGLRMESAGAALATVISQAIAFLIAIVFLARQKDFLFRFRLSSFRIHREKLSFILKTGVPSMMQSLLVHSSMTIVNSMINGFGLAASASCGIGNRLVNFFMLPRQAIANAVGGIVGQNMGAEKPDRAEQAVKLGVLFSLAAALLLFALINLFPGTTTRIFDNTPEVVEECTRYIHIVSFSFLFMAPMTVYNNLAIGVGKSTRSMINSITDSVFVRLPLCYILMKPCGLGLTGIYIGMALSPFVAMMMGWQYFHFGQWRSIKIFNGSGGNGK